MKKVLFILTLAVASLGCPKGPDNTVEVPAVDTTAVDSISVDSVK
jgi:hypothetical protein